MGSHALLQGIFLTQGSNLGLLHCRQILLQSEPPGKPILIIRKAYIFYYFISDGRVGIMYSFVYGSCNTYFRRRQWQPTLVLLSGKSHGQRSLVGCSPWSREESDTTERLHFHFSLSCTGEGNGNPLQCSCLENPRDSGVWQPANYGVAELDMTEAT